MVYLVSRASLRATVNYGSVVVREMSARVRETPGNYAH